MSTTMKVVPRVRFRLTQDWNGSPAGSILENIGPGLLDSLLRGKRGEVVQGEAPKVPERNKAMSARQKG